MKPMYTMGRPDPQATNDELVRDLQEILAQAQQDPVRVPRCVLRAIVERLKGTGTTRNGPAGPESFRPCDGPDSRW